MLVEINKTSKHLNTIKNIYFSSIPVEERIEFEDMVNLKFPNSKIFGIFDKAVLVGFTYVSLFENFAYIVYLAIDEQFRNKTYGSQALKDLCNLYKEKTKVLCVEKPITNTDMKSRRINFYKRNGFALADFEFDYLGSPYYSMYNGKFNKHKFIDFLLVCFPGCNNFKKALC